MGLSSFGCFLAAKAEKVFAQSEFIYTKSPHVKTDCSHRTCEQVVEKIVRLAGVK